MTQREIIEQVERTFDTKAIEEYERQRLAASRPPAPARSGTRTSVPVVPVVHVRRFGGPGLVVVTLGFIAVALAVLGAGLLIGDRLEPVAIPLTVQKDTHTSALADSDAATFHRRALGQFEVVTVWRYANGQEISGAPSDQLCFVGPRRQPALPIARNGTPVSVDIALAFRLNIMAEDVKAALKLCRWYGVHPIEHGMIEVRAGVHKATGAAG
jgi:hypothetical protein